MRCPCSPEGAFSTNVISAAPPSSGAASAKEAAVTPGIAREPIAHGGLLAQDALGVCDERLRDRDAHQLDLLRRREPGLHGTEGDEGPHHQARGNQQDQRQRDLQDDERVPRPMPLAAAAGTASARPSVQARPADAPCLKTGMMPNRRPDAIETITREPDDRGIDGDVAEPWQRLRPDQHEEPQRGEREPKPQEPPASARTRLSTRHSRAMRRRPAPSAARIASSC